MPEPTGPTIIVKEPLAKRTDSRLSTGTKADSSRYTRPTRRDRPLEGLRLVAVENAQHAPVEVALLVARRQLLEEDASAGNARVGGVADGVRETEQLLDPAQVDSDLLHGAVAEVELLQGRDQRVEDCQDEEHALQRQVVFADHVVEHDRGEAGQRGDDVVQALAEAVDGVEQPNGPVLARLESADLRPQHVLPAVELHRLYARNREGHFAVAQRRQRHFDVEEAAEQLAVEDVDHDHAHDDAQSGQRVHADLDHQDRGEQDQHDRRVGQLADRGDEDVQADDVAGDVVDQVAHVQVLQRPLVHAPDLLEDQRVHRGLEPRAGLVPGQHRVLVEQQPHHQNAEQEQHEPEQLRRV